MATHSEQSADAQAITKLAFYDELVKISVSKQGQENREKAKRFLKNTAALAAGAGLGTGVYMVGQRAISKAFGKSWAKLAPSTKKAILFPAAGAASIGAAALVHHLAQEKKRRGS